MDPFLKHWIKDNERTFRWAAAGGEDSLERVYGSAAATFWGFLLRKWIENSNGTAPATVSELIYEGYRRGYVVKESTMPDGGLDIYAKGHHFIRFRDCRWGRVKLLCADFCDHSFPDSRPGSSIKLDAGRLYGLIEYYCDCLPLLYDEIARTILEYKQRRVLDLIAMPLVCQKASEVKETIKCRYYILYVDGHGIEIRVRLSGMTWLGFLVSSDDYETRLRSIPCFIEKARGHLKAIAHEMSENKIRILEDHDGSIEEACRKYEEETGKCAKAGTSRKENASYRVI